MEAVSQSPLVERMTAGRRRDWEAYHDALEELLFPGATLIEIGCGDGQVLPFSWARFPDVRRIGLDPDPAAAANPLVHEFRRLDPDRAWPAEPGEADLVVSRYVLEHVADPAAFFAEAWRVLRPGGRLLFLTPNRRHPTMAASRLLPVSLKRRILKRTRGVEEDDVFETYYRANTPGGLRKQMQAAGFAEVDVQAREFTPSEYLAFSTPAYAAACAWDASIRFLDLEGLLGAHILGSARKPNR